MTRTDLTWRVTRDTGLAVAGLALLALVVAGPDVAVGLLAGGGLTILNFRWLARAARAAAGSGVSPRAGWALGSAGRLAVAGLALAAVLASGWAHPVAVAAGLVVLPVSLIRLGLATGR